MLQFATAAPAAVTVDLPAGRIQVIAADRADTTVDIRPADPAKKRDVTAAEQATAVMEDGVVRIAAAAPRSGLLGATGSLEITVQVPAGSRIEARADAAEFRGVGRLGDVTVTGAAGAVKIDEAATVHLTAQAGDITLGRLTGSAEISTLQGDIRVAEATSGTVVLRTRKGDVTVGAATGVSASLDASTALGRIDNALKNTGTTELALHASTDMGDITARSL
jgi:DUF4097 and DUF4098 domain-containing protein YvlB